MKRLPRPCLDCGVLTTNPSRCDTHLALAQQRRQQRQDNNINRKEKKARLYGGRGQGSYQAKARALRATATHCYLCLEPKTEGNPLEADHIYPELFEGSPLLPAHRSCNNSKGNRGLDELNKDEWAGLEAALKLFPPEIYLRHKLRQQR